MDPNVNGARRAVAWAFQVHALLDHLHRRDPNTGFHKLAARALANRAWDAFVEMEANPEDLSLDDDLDEALTGVERVFNAYVRQRDDHA
jgi:hypothetical protein